MGDDSSQTIALNQEILSKGKRQFCIYLKGKLYKFDVILFFAFYHKLV